MDKTKKKRFHFVNIFLFIHAWLFQKRSSHLSFITKRCSLNKCDLSFSVCENYFVKSIFIFVLNGSITDVSVYASPYQFSTPRVPFKGKIKLSRLFLSNRFLACVRPPHSPKKRSAREATKQLYFAFKHFFLFRVPKSKESVNFPAKKHDSKMSPTKQ